MTSALNAPKSVSSENPSKSVFQTNIPKLRFPEFSGEWKVKVLNDVATFLKGKNISKSDIVKDGQFECIRYGELYTDYGEVINTIVSKTNLSKDNLVFSKSNDVIIPSSGETQLDIATASCVMKDDVALGGDLNIIRTNENGIFTSFYLNNKLKRTIASLAQGNSVVHLYNHQLKDLKIKFPLIDEQQKIATFLTAVDAKIAHLSQKMSLLETYKKGAMQGIFSQKHRLEGLKDDTESVQSKSEKSANPCHLRFRQDNGNHYPDWEEKRLGEVALITTGSTPSTFNQDFYGGTKQFVSPADLKNNRYVLKTNTTLTELGFKQTRVIKKGSVLFVCIGSTIGKIGQVFEDCATNQQINALTALPNYNNDYIYSLLDYYGKSIKLLSGTQAVPQINKTVFSGVKLGFPSIEEQTKIANFLSVIDAKIALVNTQLSNAQAFKKGLLQQMFV